MTMLGNHASPWIHYLAGRHPGRVGWLVGPTTAGKKTFRRWLPYALDNDAWRAFTSCTPWEGRPFWEMLERIKDQSCQPEWVAVPDVVASRKATIENWNRYSPRCMEYGHPLAFVVQDGMKPSDVPPEASVVFIGGSFGWKWQFAETFCREFPRVHIGRVNTIGKIRRAEEMGAESVDGTGWMRRPEDDPHGWKRLEQFLAGQSDPQMTLSI